MKEFKTFNDVRKVFEELLAKGYTPQEVLDMPLYVNN